MNSDISEMPGPAVAVMERAPAHPAPITMPIAASSSSACTMAKVALPSGSMRYSFMYSIMVSTSDDEGVIGYQVTTVHAGEHAAQGCGGVAIDDDLAGGLVHALDVERTALFEIGLAA